MLVDALRNTWKISELRQKLIFTALLLIVYRIGCYVPTPGVDLVALQSFWGGQGGGILGMFNMFTGGAFERFSLFSMGIMPYINASIIMQLLTVVVPQLEALAKEGAEGRKKITQYTRYATVGLAAIQSLGLAYFMASQSGANGESIVPNANIFFYIITVLSLTTGTAFIMWLGEQITERGIGNGISLIIFAGIVAGMIPAAVQVYNYWDMGTINIGVIALTLVIMVVVTAFTIIMTQGQRRVPIQQAKRIVGRKVYGGASHFLPLKVNFAGVIPVIFAMALLSLPSTIAAFLASYAPGNLIIEWVQRNMVPGYLLYSFFAVTLIVFFTFFYTAIVVNPADMAENMKKNGSFIPGVRPGKATAAYIEKVLTRVTLVGAFFLAGIAVFPDHVIQWLGIPISVRSFIGGTALLIVVGVALDTLAQIESHLLMRHYGGFLDADGKGKGMRRR